MKIPECIQDAFQIITHLKLYSKTSHIGEWGLMGNNRLNVHWYDKNNEIIYEYRKRL